MEYQIEDSEPEPRDVVYVKTVSGFTKQKGQTRTPEMVEQALAKGGWPKIYINSTWDKVQLPAGQKNELGIRIRNAIHGNSHEGIYFTGGYGVGKTSLMGVIARQIASNYLDIPHYLPPDQVSLISPQDTYKLTQLSNASVLFIDDIHHTRKTEWVMEHWRLIIESRSANNLLTFVTSNMKLQDLSKQPEWARIASCLSRKGWMCEYVLAGYDRRKM